MYAKLLKTYRGKKVGRIIETNESEFAYLLKNNAAVKVEKQVTETKEEKTAETRETKEVAAPKPKRKRKPKL
jgi:hypothetical protein